MSRKTLTARTIASAAAALLVSMYLAAPVSAGSKFQSNIVSPPTTYDANNTTAAGGAPAIPDNTGSTAVPGLAICVASGIGGYPDNSCQGLCLGDVSTPVGTACSAVTCTGGVCKYACNGSPCSPLVCLDGDREGEACTIPGADPTECPGDTTVCAPSNVCYDPPNTRTDELCGAFGTACGTAGICGDPGCGLGAACVPVAAPDGPSATDVYGGTDQVDGQKSSCQVKGTKMQIKVAFAGTAPADTPLAAKTGAGRCTGGAPLCSKAQKCSSKGVCTIDKASPCTADGDCPLTCAKGLNKKAACFNEGDCLCLKSSDCGKDLGGVKGACTDGHEYVATVIGRMKVNPAQCLGAGQNCVLALGSPGGAGVCAAGLCAGGSRAGAVCQVASDCPGGACSAAGGALAIPAQSVSFNTVLGPAVPLCPFEFRIDQPMEVKSGKGQGKIDLAASGLGVVLPSGLDADIVGCQVHEPGISGISQLGVLVPASPVAGSAAGRAIPSLTIPLTPGTTSAGGVVGTGIGPIIGVTGAENQ
jgi:hypothetical protein